MPRAAKAAQTIAKRVRLNWMMHNIFTGTSRGRDRGTLVPADGKKCSRGSVSLGRQGPGVQLAPGGRATAVVIAAARTASLVGLRRRPWRPDGGGGEPRDPSLVEAAVLLALGHGTEGRRWRAAALYQEPAEETLGCGVLGRRSATPPVRGPERTNGGEAAADGTEWSG